MIPGHQPTTGWPAPHADQPVVGSFTVPGSKSLTNRYLVLAALADDESLLKAPLRSRDTLLMAQALRNMGVQITDVPSEHPEGDDWHIVPAQLRGPAHIDCGLAGTVMRFLPPLAALGQGTFTFDGDEHARNRPIAPVLEALRQLGVTVDDAGRGTLPFTVIGVGNVGASQVTVDASASSQFVSALLLAAARFTHGLTIRHEGSAVPSLPHIEMTVEVLRDAGVIIEDDPEAGVWHVEPSDIRSLDVVVEPDLSNAAPFLAAAAVTGGEVFMPAWPTYTTQPGDRMREILELMGAEVTLDREGLRVRGPRSLRGVDLDLLNEAELTPVVAAMMLFADTPSRIRGVGHIRGHETDRLAALTTEFTRLGGDVSETEDGLVINPRPLEGTIMRTYADHRMAMAAAVIGLRVPGTQIENVETTSKTLPGFADRWSALVSPTR